MTIIRPATSEDAQAIAHVQVSTWRSAYRGIVADKFLDSFSENKRSGRWAEIMQQLEQVTYVAAAAGYGVIGFANGGPEREGREDFRGELCGLYVLPDWHGQGIGRQLVATFARWLIGSGFETMLVWVLADNPSRRFYEHLGGKLIAQRRIEIGAQELGEVAYGWDDVRILVEEENAS